MEFMTGTIICKHYQFFRRRKNLAGTRSGSPELGATPDLLQFIRALSSLPELLPEKKWEKTKGFFWRWLFWVVSHELGARFAGDHGLVTGGCLMNCWSEFGGCSVMLNGGFCGGGFVWFHWLFWSISARKEVVFWSWGCGFEVVVSFFGVVSSPEKMMRMRGEAGQRGRRRENGVLGGSPENAPARLVAGKGNE
ncbi:hypothetical protein KY285_002138 [Solanum tuberosum]|nr:hypothetical protein KY285_002138 [Solanum tuberosum]